MSHTLALRGFGIAVAIAVLSSSAWAGNRLSANYTVMPAQRKQAHLFGHVERSAYDQLPDHNARSSLRHLIAKLVPTNLRRSFDHKEDTHPEGISGAPKIVHRHGTVAPVTVQINDVVYPGITRFSLAIGPANNFIPGLAIKLLRDGPLSINLHVMDSPVGQGQNKNFFARTFANTFRAPGFRESPAVWAMGKVFGLVKADANFLPIPLELLRETGLPLDAHTIEFHHTSGRPRSPRREHRARLSPGARPEDHAWHEAVEHLC
jgi:hypothetical protein